LERGDFGEFEARKRGDISPHRPKDWA
jgi:hypothetical protein